MAYKYLLILLCIPLILGATFVDVNIKTENSNTTLLINTTSEIKQIIINATEIRIINYNRTDYIYNDTGNEILYNSTNTTLNETFDNTNHYYRIDVSNTTTTTSSTTTTTLSGGGSSYTPADFTIIPEKYKDSARIGENYEGSFIVKNNLDYPITVNINQNIYKSDEPLINTIFFNGVKTKSYRIINETEINYTVLMQHLNKTKDYLNYTITIKGTGLTKEHEVQLFIKDGIKDEIAELLNKEIFSYDKQHCISESLCKDVKVYVDIKRTMVASLLGIPIICFIFIAGKKRKTKKKRK